VPGSLGLYSRIKEKCWDEVYFIVWLSKDNINGITSCRFENRQSILEKLKQAVVLRVVYVVCWDVRKIYRIFGKCEWLIDNFGEDEGQELGVEKC